MCSHPNPENVSIIASMRTMEENKAGKCNAVNALQAMRI
jgi:hypothetical protein